MHSNVHAVMQLYACICTRSKKRLICYQHWPHSSGGWLLAKPSAVTERQACCLVQPVFWLLLWQVHCHSCTPRWDRGVDRGAAGKAGDTGQHDRGGTSTHTTAAAAAGTAAATATGSLTLPTGLQHTPRLWLLCLYEVRRSGAVLPSYVDYLHQILLTCSRHRPCLAP